jgi:hypothetical protein
MIEDALTVFESQISNDHLMAAEYSSFAGWERNLKLSNGFVEVIITLEVGPRIISYRPVQGRSVFKLVDEEAAKSKEDVWKIRGGHRLWTAPEDFGKEDSLCYALDNSEVEHAIEDDFTVKVSNLIEKPTKIRREMVVRLERTNPKVTVEHRITNEGGMPLEIAPWALSVMAEGGYAVLSQPPLGTHPQDYLPNRSIVAWPFTDLSDERFRVGPRTICLYQTHRPPFKIGLRHSEGWAAYILGDHLFMKNVPFTEGESYPDFGSNFETFTNAEFLELETLGPLKRISAGEALVHSESWVVFSEVQLPDVKNDKAFLKALDPYKRQLLRP